MGVYVSFGQCMRCLFRKQPSMRAIAEQIAGFSLLKLTNETGVARLLMAYWPYTHIKALKPGHGGSGFLKIFFIFLIYFQK